jgi:hypothetical protein
MHHRVSLVFGACVLVFLLGVPAPAADESAGDERLLKDNKIETDAPTLLGFFRKRAGSASDDDQTKALIRQLGDEDFWKRQQASGQLVGTGKRAKQLLRQALDDADCEIRWRAKECLRLIDLGEGSVVVAAAVRTLARHRPAGAVEALLDFLPAAEDEIVSAEIQDALTALAVRDDKPEPALVEALKDKVAVKRAAAGVALCRAKVAAQLPAVRKLLQDADVSVRARAALALAVAREKEAVPVLIALLDQPRTPETRVIPEVLHRLARDKGPTAPTRSDEASRRKYHDAWKAWWEKEGEKFDTARLEEAAKTAGGTLVVLLDLGKVVYLDSANRPRWQLGELGFPLDAQLLPNEHVLLAEHNANLVTERNLKNEIVWKKEVDTPIAAQRLANGNTFIATKSHLYEFDPKGAEVFNYARPNGEQIMKAQRLTNGEYVVITLGTARCVRIDAKGKELGGFHVNVNYSGGHLDVLPNGHILIAETNVNRVVEYTSDGQIAWEAQTDLPVAAVRLPTGNTLVTSMNPERGAVELDRAGKEVWQYKTDTRVTRAFRRE